MASLLVASEARRHAEWCRAARDDELVAVTELSSPKGTLVQVLLLPEYAAALEKAHRRKSDALLSLVFRRNHR